MREEDISNIKRIVSPTMRRAQLSTARGSIESVKDSGNIQTVQVTLLAEEVRDKVEKIGEYGISSNPPPGSDAAVIFVGGNRDHGLVIGTENRQFRKTGLKPGEVCLYDHLGQEIYIKTTGEIIITNSVGNKIEIGLTSIKITGMGVETIFDISGVKTKANISDSVGTLAQLRAEVAALKAAYNSHTHPYLNMTSPSTTGQTPNTA